MFEEEASEDMNPDEARDMGAKRFASMSIFDAPVYLRPDPVWRANVRDLARRQMNDDGLEALLCSYIEMMGRAKSLVDFWEYNVGPTVDWPVSVMGESAEVEACLTRRVDKLRSVVAFVEDTACS